MDSPANKTKPSVEEWRAKSKPARKPFEALSGESVAQLSGPGSPGFHQLQLGLQRALGNSTSWLVRPQLGGADELEQPFFESWVVYACCRVLQRAVASVPPIFWRTDDDDAEEVPKTHPLVRTFMRPNARMTWGQLLGAGVIHRKLTGEDFWFLVDRMGNPLIRIEGSDDGRGDNAMLPMQINLGNGPSDIQIVPVIGSAVSDERDPRTGLVRAWWYSQSAAISDRFHTSSVVPFFDYNPADPCRGVGDAEIALRQLNITYQIERYQEAIMRNGGPGAFMTTENAVEPNEQRRQQEEIDARMEDARSVGKIKLVYGANWKVIPNPVSPKDMQGAEALAWYRDAVASIFGVPLPIIGVLDNATYSNMGEAWRQFWLGVVDYLKSVEDVINSSFISNLSDPEMRQMRMGFDYSTIAALREDQSKKFETAANIAAKGVGWSMNESCAQVGLDIEGPDSGDVAIATTGTTTFDVMVDTAENPPEPAPAPAPGAAPKEEAPKTDEGKSTPKATLSHPALTEPERRAYVERFAVSVIKNGDARLRAAVAKWFRGYYLDEIKILVDVAEHGLNSRSARYRSTRAAPEADDIERYLMVNREKWRRLLDAAVEPHIDGVFERALKDMAIETDSLAIPMTDPRILTVLSSQKMQLVEGVESTLADEVRSIILETLSTDATTGDLQTLLVDALPELKGNLAQAFATKNARAQTIARTETGHAASVARNMQMVEAGVTKHQWAASNDAATRESHLELDGEIRTIGVPFKPRLMFPHDPNGDADEVINCRCIAVPVEED